MLKREKDARSARHGTKEDMVAAMENDHPNAEERRRVDALDRVLTRLALTASKNLEKVLDKLLPAVISELNAGGNLVLHKVRDSVVREH